MDRLQRRVAPPAAVTGGILILLALTVPVAYGWEILDDRGRP